VIPLTKLKKDVAFNKELTHIVDVLKGIAASRFHSLERQLVLFDRFFKEAGQVLDLVDIRTVYHPFVQERSEVTGVIIVTSDSGFLGGLNNQVVYAGLSEAGEDPRITVIGERGADFLKGTGQKTVAFPGIEDNTRLSLSLAVRDHVVDQVLKGECGRLLVVYPKAVSFTVQKVTVETLLPCTSWIPQKLDKDVRTKNMIFESRMEHIVEYVVEQWIGHRLNEIFALSRLAELSARAVHLEGSYQELLQEGKKINLQYLRARHEIIDRSIREVFAAKLLYGKKNEN